MKIALPTKDGQIDSHFGHCAYYTIFTVDKGQIINEETLESPQGCGCKSDIASVMATSGVRVLLGGNMGDGALKVLNANGIEVCRGCSGDVKTVAEAWLRGEIKDNLEACNHTHEHGHTCSGHHN